MVNHERQCAVKPTLGCEVTQAESPGEHTEALLRDILMSIGLVIVPHLACPRDTLRWSRRKGDYMKVGMGQGREVVPSGGLGRSDPSHDYEHSLRDLTGRRSPNRH